MEHDVPEIQFAGEHHVFLVGDALPDDLEPDPLILKQLRGPQDMPHAVERCVFAVKMHHQIARRALDLPRMNDAVIDREKQPPQLARIDPEEAAEVGNHVIGIEDGNRRRLVRKPVAEAIDTSLERPRLGLPAVEDHGVVGRDVHVEHDRLPGQKPDERHQQLPVEAHQNDVTARGIPQRLQQQPRIVAKPAIRRRAERHIVTTPAQGLRDDARARVTRLASSDVKNLHPTLLPLEYDRCNPGPLHTAGLTSRRCPERDVGKACENITGLD